MFYAGCYLSAYPYYSAAIYYCKLENMLRRWYLVENPLKNCAGEEIDENACHCGTNKKESQLKIHQIMYRNDA